MTTILCIIPGGNTRFYCICLSCVVIRIYFDKLKLDYCAKYVSCPPPDSCVYDASTHTFGCKCPANTEPNSVGFCLPSKGKQNF